MTRLLARCLATVPTLIGVVVVAFLLTRVLPGDPAALFAAHPGMTPADLAELRAGMGLDAPLPEQFRLYVLALWHGDLGYSHVTGRPVTAELAVRFPATLELTLCAFALALAVALPLGVLAALRPGSWLDRLCRIAAGLGVALPAFVTGLLLILLFYAGLGVAPEPTGRLDPFLIRPPQVTGFLTVDAALAGEWAALRSGLAHLVLPVVSMAVFAFGPLLRMMRGAMEGVLSQEFIRAARGLGLRPRQVVLSYALRNALLPVVTLAGLTLSYMIAANVLVEKIFAWPGMGAFALDSLIALDYAPVQAFVLLLAGVFVAVNLATDIVAGLIDPRAGLA